MSYEHFALVCGHPETLTVPRPDDSLSLSGALEEVFPSSTNLLVLQWDDVFVPLSFKYVVSWILLDAIEMIEQMLSASGPAIVTAHFPSNTFQVVWEISDLENGGIEINATWNAVVGNVEGLLADRSPSGPMPPRSCRSGGTCSPSSSERSTRRRCPSRWSKTTTDFLGCPSPSKLIQGLQKPSGT